MIYTLLTGAILLLIGFSDSIFVKVDRKNESH